MLVIGVLYAWDYFWELVEDYPVTAGTINQCF